MRGFEGPQLKQGGLERVVEAFYIAKMKYEHEARLSTRDSRLANALAWGTGAWRTAPWARSPHPGSAPAAPCPG